MRIFKDKINIPYIKHNSKVKSNIKAVIHYPNEKIMAYRTLKELKKDNPEFKHLSKAVILINGYENKIYIRSN